MMTYLCPECQRPLQDVNLQESNYGAGLIIRGYCTKGGCQLGSVTMRLKDKF